MTRMVIFFGQLLRTLSPLSHCVSRTKEGGRSRRRCVWVDFPTFLPETPPGWQPSAASREKLNTDWVSLHSGTFFFKWLLRKPRNRVTWGETVCNPACTLIVYVFSVRTRRHRLLPKKVRFETRKWLAESFRLPEYFYFFFNNIIDSLFNLLLFQELSQIKINNQLFYEVHLKAEDAFSKLPPKLGIIINSSN